MAVSREEIRWAYRMILGREPESEDAYLAQRSHPDVGHLRSCLLSSEEGLARIHADIGALVPQLHFDYNRRMIVHLHIEKTGGTFLYEAIAPVFKGRLFTRPHTTFIQTYTMGELNQFDFVSGHLTLDEAIALPRTPKTIICLFRQPHARLISFYRFHRAHAEASRDKAMIRLAQDLLPAEFFAHPTVRSSHRLFNAYLRVLVGLPDEPEWWNQDVLVRATGLALARLKELSVVGTTEDLTGALLLARAAIGCDLVEPSTPVHSTSGLSALNGFRLAPHVELTDEIKDAMQPLIEYDLVIYEQAKQLASERMKDWKHV